MPQIITKANTRTLTTGSTPGNANCEYNSLQVSAYTGVLGDLRHSLRALAKSRSFALVAILSLALGIGANTIIFTLLNAIFLHPLPVQDPSSLVAMFTSDPHNPGLLYCSYPNYLEY